MKKIMFNDKYGLTDAVLQGRKKMTRRICKEFRTGRIIYANEVESIGGYSDENLVEFVMKDGSIKVSVPPYKPGEIVAVAQSYQTILDTVFGEDQQWKCGYMRDVEESHEKMWEDIKGRTNKMFVKEDFMPHQIRITDIKIERLQDISADDCMREGIYVSDTFTKYGIRNGYSPQCANDPKEKKCWFNSPKEAFADLIDKVSGKGTWNSNPYVFAYTFELVK